MEWIKVSKRLPGKYKRVLISDGKGVCIGIQQSGFDSLIYCSRYCETCNANGYEDYAITHWAELPELPKDENEVD
jgi:hypothetical protein